jgi:hypothetical protein
MPAALHFPNRVQGPPGGWRYRVPETGQLFDAVTESHLLEKLVKHYKANGLAVPANLPALVEHHICTQATGYCVEHDGTPPVTPGQMATVAFHLVLEGTRKLVGIAERVTEEQATARALTCAACVENVPREGCSQCNMNTVRDLIVRTVGKRGTQHDDKLNVCRVCLCELRAKVHLPLSRLKAMATPEQWAALPGSCWMKQEEGVGK